MKLIWMAFGLCLAFAATQAKANIYKCSVGGKVVYQESPCGEAEIKGDTPWERQRNAKKRAEEERARLFEAAVKRQEEESQVRQAELQRLQSCKAEPGSCSLSQVRSTLLDESSVAVINVLGHPDNTQLIGDQELIYYTLSLRNGERAERVRLQLVVRRYIIREVNVY